MEAPVDQSVRAVPDGCCKDKGSDSPGKRIVRQTVPESCETPSTHTDQGPLPQGRGSRETLGFACGEHQVKAYMDQAMC